ncbi:MAG: methyltransferase domain-containing protein [Acidimicrobiia bacterium]
MTRDLMFKDEIQELVYTAYDALDSPNGPATRFYTRDQLDRLPAGARDWALGVGNPTRHAKLAQGEHVADLGCGSGVDVLLAAGAVGPDGHVVGVDFLASMVERGAELAHEAGLANTIFLQGEIEDLPLADKSVDVVISNGAANLSARKSRVFAEAWRILRPGGRICLADLTLSEDRLPPEILTHPSAWAG